MKQILGTMLILLFAGIIFSCSQINRTSAQPVPATPAPEDVQSSTATKDSLVFLNTPTPVPTLNVPLKQIIFAIDESNSMDRSFKYLTQVPQNYDVDLNRYKFPRMLLAAFDFLRVSESISTMPVKIIHMNKRGTVSPDMPPQYSSSWFGSGYLGLNKNIIATPSFSNFDDISTVVDDYQKEDLKGDQALVIFTDGYMGISKDNKISSYPTV